MDATLLNSLIGQTPLAAILFFLLKILWDKLKDEELKNETRWLSILAERKEEQAERKKEYAQVLNALEDSTKVITRNNEVYSELMNKIKEG